MEVSAKLGTNNEEIFQKLLKQVDAAKTGLTYPVDAKVRF